MLIKFEVYMQLAIVIIIDHIFHRSQEILNGILDQQGIAKDTHDLSNRSVQFEVVSNNCDETVRDDGDMYLYSDCILRFSPKGSISGRIVCLLQKFGLHVYAVYSDS